MPVVTSTMHHPSAKAALDSVAIATYVGKNAGRLKNKCKDLYHAYQILAGEEAPPPSPSSPSSKGAKSTSLATKFFKTIGGESETKTVGEIELEKLALVIVLQRTVLDSCKDVAHDLQVCSQNIPKPILTGDWSELFKCFGFTFEALKSVEEKGNEMVARAKQRVEAKLKLEKWETDPAIAEGAEAIEHEVAMLLGRDAVELMQGHSYETLIAWADFRAREAVIFQDWLETHAGYALSNDHNGTLSSSMAAAASYVLSGFRSIDGDMGSLFGDLSVNDTGRSESHFPPASDVTQQSPYEYLDPGWKLEDLSPSSSYSASPPVAYFDANKHWTDTAKEDQSTSTSSMMEQVIQDHHAQGSTPVISIQASFD